MPKTVAELERELKTLLEGVKERFDVLVRSMDEVNRKQADGGEKHAALHREVVVLREQTESLKRSKIEVGSLEDINTQLAVIKRDVDELRKEKDQWTQRLWNLIFLIVGASLTFFLREWFSNQR